MSEECSDSDVERLKEIFRIDEERAREVLKEANNDLQKAADRLSGSNEMPELTSASQTEPLQIGWGSATGNENTWCLY
ncbi:5027_t:CDS:2 [Paraglomus brasilianum]|uniref:5027_t:CDS:1 n=1 Tax=Paraglomus brasilianum TaxID=144538 RepID=A0A9N9BSJ7_9GLOM|nr:5027_t:CDS:2 [Paraglomus brasilianum]